jgi:putative nucleotidyltransferase with HDIG domain
MNRMSEIKERLRSIPSLPAAAIEAIRMAHDPDVDFNKLARTIEYDPGLTSNVLRLANSAYFGGMGRIKSMKDAIVRLGLKNVFQMIMASAVAPMVQKEVHGYDLKPGYLWSHSVAVAVGAREIAVCLKRNAPEYSFTAGLLHDIGKLVLGTFVEIDAAAIMQKAFDEGVSFEIAEKSVLGFDHAEIGAALLKQWNIPSEIVDVVRWHHDPENAPNRDIVLDLVHVADAISMTTGLGTGLDGLNYRTSADVATRLDLTDEIAEKAVVRITDTLEQMPEIMRAGAMK